MPFLLLKKIEVRFVLSTTKAKIYVWFYLLVPGVLYMDAMHLKKKIYKGYAKERNNNCTFSVSNIQKQLWKLHVG